MNHLSSYTKQIKNEALRLGFSDCGISRAEILTDDFRMLQSWLDKKYHAGLAYMERNNEKREDITKLVEGAKSVISVILNYFPSEKQSDPEAPVLSKYAYGKDYHEVMMIKLGSLIETIRTVIPGTNGRAFVDSAPVLEHAWAVRAGLGWIGKNSLLLSKKHGSFVFIGELVVDIELEYDSPAHDLCGNCNNCITSCPTGAIRENRLVDSGKCISYHTIENKTDKMPGELKSRFMNRVFGCDICQDVCPWNKSPESHHVHDFNPHPDMLSMTKQHWYSIDKERFNELFTHSAVKRAKYTGLKRNLRFLQ